MTPQFMVIVGILIIIVGLFLLFQARFIHLFIRAMEAQRGSFTRFLAEMAARTGPDTGAVPTIGPNKPKPPTGGRTVRQPSKLN